MPISITTTGSLEISVDIFNPTELEKELKLGLQEVIASHEAQLTRGQNPGTNGPMKPYAKGYIRAILAGEVKGPGGVAKTSITPNMKISGRLRSSRRLQKIKGGWQEALIGQHYSGDSNHALAMKLEKKWTGWTGFGPKDLKLLDKRLQKWFRDTIK